MPQCGANKVNGDRCKGVAIDSLGFCYAHHPDHAEKRRRDAAKGGKRGGRGRSHTSELQEIRKHVNDLAAGVLTGHFDTGAAAVAVQCFNTLLRIIEIERRVREADELEARIERLERAQARGGGRTT